MNSQNQQLPVYWINIMERDDWLVINLEGRKLGLIMSVTEGGLLYLTVAGYHSGFVYCLGIQCRNDDKRSVARLFVFHLSNLQSLTQSALKRTNERVFRSMRYPVMHNPKL